MMRASGLLRRDAGTTVLDQITINDANEMARRLRAAMVDRGLAASDGDSQDLVAAQLGHSDWSAARTALAPDQPDHPGFTHLIPVLRSLDEAKCRAFYCGFLGFEVFREHRFEQEFAPHLPLYLVFHRGQVQLHISEHPDHATVGSAIFIWLTDIDSFRRELLDVEPRHPIREIADQPWGRELVLIDPFGNRLRFCERHQADSSAHRRTERLNGL